jgi:hypothetical protein
MHDRDGRIRARVDAYVLEHPGASFEEIERACFPGLDGTFDYRAISPRHLEACATRTVQVLVDGSYNGILQPGTHYIPVRADFDNISEVVSQVASHEGSEIAERAYRDVVASGRYTYEAYVAALLEAAPPRNPRATMTMSFPTRFVSRLEQAADRPSWAIVHVYQRLRPAVRAGLRRIGLLDAFNRARARRRLRRERGA